MTDSKMLLTDLQARVTALQDDLRERAASVPEFDRALRDEYASAMRVHRTAQTFETWREDEITQAAVAWVLATVFVRFLEDNELIDPRLSGPRDRRAFALDRHAAYFQSRPLETDREYFLHVFGEVAELPAAREIFDEAHNPLWRLTPSGDAAKALLEFWQRIDPATGAIAHELVEPTWDTRLLGDLYQDLSEAARKKYALLQTPRFVEAFILDRTLTPAIGTFGYREVTVLDPTCGSGHFLLGAFERLLGEYQRHEPASNERERVQRVLSQVSGVDLNPFASAIARFRLLIASLRACGITRLADAPAFEVQVGTGDSLLRGPRFSDPSRGLQVPLLEDDPTRHHFFAEDDRADRILSRQHHVVVGNPPYITVKDRALNALYRDRYGSCHMKYSLVVPFTERFFELATAEPAGFVGFIAANSFMKREFGSKLIAQYLPNVDLTHVVDTSGAYIPGHGTPTVILFGRNRRPSGPTRTVMGIRGEPTTPDDPARGQVWSAILQQIDVVGSESEFVSVRDLEQVQLYSHPWNIGGGGAAELKDLLDERALQILGDVASEIGVMLVTSEDAAFTLSEDTRRRLSIPARFTRTLVSGDEIRDWRIQQADLAIFPYDGATLKPVSDRSLLRFLWPLRVTLSNRLWFKKRQVDRGLHWFEYGFLAVEKLKTPLTISLAEVATHNHFVFDRGNRIFKQTAPVIKLPADATENDHFALLGLLNSSTACFWIKQVCQTKGSSGMGRGIYDEKWEFFYQIAGTALETFPVVNADGCADIATKMDRIASELQAQMKMPNVERITRDAAGELFETLVTLQEELDWAYYARFGLTDDLVSAPCDPPGLRFGQRAFEIALARRVREGLEVSEWFSRHGAVPVTDVPMHWPDQYRRVVERRIELIESNRAIGLVERPEYKRRWNVDSFDVRRQRALQDWLLARLEDRSYWLTAALTTAAKLADVARADSEFMRVAEQYRGRADFDVAALVRELVEAEGVPYLSELRYKESGLRKRAQWEGTWHLQRQEDAIDARVELPEGEPNRLTRDAADRLKREQVGVIPVPPKYLSADFRSSDYWRLRGKLDVPKERFILYPGAERAADPTPLVGWAGWNHLQQAQALADYFVRVREQEAWSVDRLTPLLAGLLELVPWLKQWHNDVNPEFGVRMGDHYAEFVEQQARALGLTVEGVRTWRPEPTGKGRKSRKRARHPSLAAVQE